MGEQRLRKDMGVFPITVSTEVKRLCRPFHLSRI